MLPKYFASTIHLLTITLALVTLNSVCKSLEVQATELMDGSDYSPRQPTQSSAGKFAVTTSPILVAQAFPNLSQDLPRDIPPQSIPRDPSPDTEPLPTEPPTPLPPPEQLLQPSESSPIAPDVTPSTAPQTVFVEEFSVVDSTVFDADELATLAWQATTLDSDTAIPDLIRSYLDSDAAIPDFCKDDSRSDSSETPAEASQDTEDSEDRASTIDARASPSQETTATNITNVSSTPKKGWELSFEQLLRARSTITQLYIKCGYITSGAILPPQTPEAENNVVEIKIVEGRLEDIEVTGLRRLNPGYVRSRLAIAGSEPLNRKQLVRGLQLLQLNPLIRRISADLQTGTRPATSILRVEATEADSFDVTFDLNNNRSPSVSSFQRGITFNQANLLGFGDGLSVTYDNTDGSNKISSRYIIPVNPRNGTLAFRYDYINSDVVESPFDVLDIEAESSYYEVTFRQPVFQIPTEEFVLGLTFSRQESQTEVGFDDIGPFPLSLGADEEGRTKVSAIRFTQEWLKRTPRQVLAARSEFSLGLDLFDATINDDPLPDGRFFVWRGQGQWVRQLNDSGLLLLVRGNVQLTGDSLVPFEQFALGGQDTIRGYRQDELTSDNGVYGSVEVRFPVLRFSQRQGIFYLIPFFDVGTGWNNEFSDNLEDTTLVSTGIGLGLDIGDDLRARVDWGIPLVSIDREEQTWQENGVYFSIQYSPF
ncbi:MAG: ShlB/FhaC/HecB family hemolysin secretion/activation protein [Xenococcaceae cyanobacterium MO_188.B29]|nr:ShlB/FhaC/HecB family hemolysin secretion/activation protein [Xenococcaceae cyanobacterium MO_188.B29]